MTLWHFLEPGDRAVILVPTYGQTPGLAEGFGARVATFALEEGLSWQPSPGAAEAAITPGTFRWLVALHLAGAAAVAGLSWLAVSLCGPEVSPAARRWAAVIAALVVCQLVLGAGAWVVSWGVPSGLLPANWMPAEPIAARSPRGAAVVTGHVVLGMMILGGSVALAIAAGLFAKPAARAIA